MKNTGYNSVVVFERGLTFKDNKGNPLKIYGLLFNKDKSNPNDLFMWSLNRFICYLLSAEGVESRGGEIEQEMWTCDKGKMILVMTNNIKNFIYKALKKDIIPYRIVEYDKELEILEGEHLDSFIVSNNILIRLGLVDGKEEKLDVKNVARQHIILQKLQTLSEFNEMDDGDSEDMIEIASNQGIKPTELSISEKEKRALQGMLLLEDFNNDTNLIDDTRYVKTYEEFLNMNETFQKRPPQDPDYDDRPEGWRNEDMEEEE